MASEARDAMAAQLDRRTRLAEDKIARAEAQAAAEVRTAAAEIAVAAARRVIADRLDTAAGAKLIDASIADLPAKLN
ncbi:MAG: hypothetical protein AAGL49_11540 [Pseudomonadota bacterium]